MSSVRPLRAYRPPCRTSARGRSSGHAPLTTQSCLPEAPYKAADPFIERSLIVDVSSDRGALGARYDFVLRPT